MEKSAIFEVYEERKGSRRYIYTQSFAPGFNVYGEIVKREGGIEYREWDPTRSKIAAAIMKGVPNIFIRRGHVVLYLGAASGTTASHVSDIVGEEGFVFCLDFAPRSMRDLVFVCEKRHNMAPLLEDAHHPENYSRLVQPSDIVFQDIAQKDQVEIFIKNVKEYLKKDGTAILTVKSRSIDVTMKPRQVFSIVKAKLDKEFKIVDSRELDPFERDHMIFFCKRP
jgi:fibrillarin-like pre-rRNA processing protein